MGQSRNDKVHIGEPVLDSSMTMSVSKEMTFLYLTMAQGMFRGNSG